MNTGKIGPLSVHSDYSGWFSLSDTGVSCMLLVVNVGPVNVSSCVCSIWRRLGILGTMTIYIMTKRFTSMVVMSIILLLF